MLRDVRYGLRLIGRQPGFALAAILTLALGLGANTAIFTVAWQLMLKPLPYPASDRLVEVWETTDKANPANINPVAPAFYHQWLADPDVFDALAAYSYFQPTANLTGAGDPEQLVMRNVTGDYFRVFKMAPLLGRTLGQEDTLRGSTSVVLSEGLWRRRFGADPLILGRTIRLFDDARTVVGVMPAAFEASAGRVDVWSGLGFTPEQARTGLAHYLGVVGRLKPGVTIEDAGRRVAADTERTVPLYPVLSQKLSARVRSVESERGGALREGVLSLIGAAGFVLLIACANLASLQLARGVARSREFGIRAAIGASRVRLMRQVLVESLVLAAIGACAGLLASSLLLRALEAMAPASIRLAAQSGVDTVIVLYTIGLALVAAVLFALAPAWRASSRATTWLRQRASTGDRRATAARSVLVGGQVALAVVLLVGASLLISSLNRVLDVSPGFDPAGALSFDLSIYSSRLDSDVKRIAFYDDVGEAMRALPGVTGACATSAVPFDGDPVTMTYVPDGETRLIPALPRTIEGDCFSLLKLQLLRGRPFDTREPARVAIVTESLAASAWPGQDPIGRKLRVGVPTGDLIEVVGVVSDSLQRSLERGTSPQVYEAARDNMSFRPTNMLVRSSVPPETLFAAVREAVRRIDPDQPVARLRTLEAIVSQTTSPRRFNLALLGGFALVAFVLAVVGIVGLEHETVAERRGEIGIRLALGATTRSVVRLVLVRALFSVAIGLALGLGGAWLASRLLAQQLFGVRPTDPAIYAGVAIGLGVAAVLAAWLPARRAARVDPTTVLRG
jgi:putative ABC transport system permease protein